MSQLFMIYLVQLPKFILLLTKHLQIIRFDKINILIMIDQAEQRTVTGGEKDSLNASFEKSKTTEDDDTLSLQSQRSQQFINEKAQDWPSWTVQEKQGHSVQGVNQVVEGKKQNQNELGVGIVNESEVKQLLHKYVPRKYGRGMVRWEKRKQEIKQATQKNPVYDAKKN